MRLKTGSMALALVLAGCLAEAAWQPPQPLTFEGRTRFYDKRGFKMRPEYGKSDWGTRWKQTLAAGPNQDHVHPSIRGR